MKAGAGAKLANKPDVEAAGGRAGEITKAQIFRRRYGRIRQPVEIICDRKMFRDIALPRGHDAATGLDPGRHLRKLPKPPFEPRLHGDTATHYVNLSISG